MPVTCVFPMQNNYSQNGNVRVRTRFANGDVNRRVNVAQAQGKDEGICTIISLQWAKRCLQLHRGIGSQNELIFTDHMLNGLMAVWRKYDNSPHEQTRAMGLNAPGGDSNTGSVRTMQRRIGASASQIGIFWNSFHTMGYRVGVPTVGKLALGNTPWGAMRRQRAQPATGTVYEWFDANHGLYTSNDAQEMYRFMRQYMDANYGEPIMGYRIVSL